MAQYWPVVKREGGKYHLVPGAGGSALDGSLHGFLTKCGIEMRQDTNDDQSRWREVRIGEDEALPRQECCARCFGHLDLFEIAHAPITMG